jgi:WD40 repeat protein
LATACGDQNIRIWDTADGTLRSELAGHQAAVGAVAFSHGGDVLVSSSYDMTMRLWDTRNWRLVVTKAGAGANARMPVSPDDRQLGYSTGGTKLGICNVGSGLECRQLWLDPKLTRWTEACEFSPDGRLLVSGHNDGARVWDLGSGRQLALLPETNVSCAGFAGSGRFLVTSGGGGLKRLTAENTPDNRGLRFGSPAFVGGRPISVEPFSVTANGKTLAVNADYNVIIFDTGSGGAKHRFNENVPFYRCALSSDGKCLAAADLPHTLVRAWNLENTNIFHDLPCRWVNYLKFSPDGQQLVTGSTYDYRTWDTRSWQCGRVIPRSEAGSNSRIAFAPDGQLMAVTDSSFTVRLLEPATGRELATFGMPEPQLISCLAFSPDGSQLAVGGRTPVIYVWNLRLIRQELAEMKLDWE